VLEGGRGAFTDRVAVVTGAGSGLGRAAALALARQGARIVAADFDAPRMQHTVDEILRLGTADSAIGLEADIRDDSSVRGLARSALKAFGRADIIVNAAGVLLQGKLDKISPHDWDWMLGTNVLGPVRVAQMHERIAIQVVAVLGHALGIQPGLGRYCFGVCHDRESRAFGPVKQALEIPSAASHQTLEILLRVPI